MDFPQSSFKYGSRGQATKTSTRSIQSGAVCDGNPLLRYVLVAARCLILFGLYGGLTGVKVAILAYSPAGVYDDATFGLPAPAIMCTMMLTTVFFSTQLVIALCESYTEFTGVQLSR